MHKSPGQQLSDYRRFRAVQMRLNASLTRSLPTGALKWGGARLGILKNNTLVFRSQSETSVLMDYCIYDYRQSGANVVEKYILQTAFEPASDERILLEAMRQARYSVFAVDEIEKGMGVLTHDLLRGDSGFITDIALSETAVRGMALACRIISPGEGRLSMGTGAALPGDPDILKKIGEKIPAAFGKTVRDIALLSPDRRADLSAAIIRIFLEGDSSLRVSYENPGDRGKPKGLPKTHYGVASASTGNTGDQERQVSLPGVGRNEPCPCGSGKKYKRCCGR